MVMTPEFTRHSRAVQDRGLITQIERGRLAFTWLAADHQRSGAGAHAHAGALDIGGRSSTGLGIAGGCLMTYERSGRNC
jgi:hypothetical protein